MGSPRFWAGCGENCVGLDGDGVVGRSCRGGPFGMLELRHEGSETRCLPLSRLSLGPFFGSWAGLHGISHRSLGRCVGLIKRHFVELEHSPK